jgi:hypothetical protein
MFVLPLVGSIFLRNEPNKIFIISEMRIYAGVGEESHSVNCGVEEPAPFGTSSDNSPSGM